MHAGQNQHAVIYNFRMSAFTPSFSWPEYLKNAYEFLDTEDGLIKVAQSTRCENQFKDLAAWFAKTDGPWRILSTGWEPTVREGYGLDSHGPNQVVWNARYQDLLRVRRPLEEGRRGRS